MTEITMPRLSDSMEEGTILTWLIADGDEVGGGRRAGGDRDRQGDDDLQRRGRGHAGDHRRRRARRVPVGAVDRPSWRRRGRRRDGAWQAPERRRARPIRAAAAERATAAARPTAADRPRGDAAGPAARGRARRRRSPPSPAPDRAGASPAPTCSAAAGVARGRAGRPATAPAPSRVPASRAAADTARGEVTAREELTRLQQVIARRMAEAKATVPHFQVQTEVADGRGDRAARRAQGAGRRRRRRARRSTT